MMLTAMRKTFRVAYLLLLTLLLPGVQSVLAAAAPLPAAPSLSARTYLLEDFNSGYVLAEKDADKRMEPASITKLMTAYVVFRELKAGRLKMKDEVLISEKAWRMQGSRTFLEVNTKVPVDTLLQGMITQSGNDATVALAEKVAGTEETFASLMNQVAQELGLKGTHFVNSTGMPDPNHYSTARDIAHLTRALIRDFPEYYRYYSEKEFTYNGIHQYNRNKLLWRDKSVDGVKTGHTESAGYCLVSSAKRNSMRLISVVLEDRSEEARAVSSQALLNYGFRFYETRELYGADKPLKEVRIWKGAQSTVPLGLDKDLYVTFPRGQYNRLKASVNFTPEIVAPVQKGQSFGTLNVSLDNQVIAERPLVALQPVEEGGWWQQATDGVRLWFK
jgi:D-alanyl-D-alanine carboxypeptidase (penicillin-binding protein 5/6)